MLFSIPAEAEEIISVLENNGHEAYLVGGCVRDYLMDITPYDFDICTSALPEEISSLFARTVHTGIRHGTVTVLKNHGSFEVTTFRVESGYSDHRHPDNVRFSSSLIMDLQRRDFTVNAMAYHPEKGLIDPFGGADDIKEKLIRSVGNPDERFGEDSLRMLRAIRFQAKSGFTVEQKTLRAIHVLAKAIKYVSHERILAEMNGILCGGFPEAILNLFATGLVRYILPVPVFLQPDVSPFFHLEQKPSVRWAAFFKQTGIICLPEIKNTCDYLKMSNSLKRDILLTSGVLKGHFPDTPFRIRITLSSLGLDIFSDSLKILRATGFEPDAIENIEVMLEKIIREKHCTHPSTLTVKGGDLISEGIPPGRILGDILDVLFLCVLQNPLLNRRDILIKIAEEINAKYQIGYHA